MALSPLTSSADSHRAKEESGEAPLNLSIYSSWKRLR